MISPHGAGPSADRAMTWAEICQRYPDRWVVLLDTDWVDDHGVEFRTARVVGHHVRRATALAEAQPLTWGVRRVGCFFTGRKRATLPGFAAPRPPAPPTVTIPPSS